MEKAEFIELLDDINQGFEKRKDEINQVLNEELSKGNSISFSKISHILDKYKDEDFKNPENKNIAVCYDGKLEITLTYILDSIIYGNKVTLCVKEHSVLNDILTNIIYETLRKKGIKNTFYIYNSSFNELYLRDNVDKFDKLVYIGDYFEYERFKNFLKREVEYNNYGSIKLFINQKQFAAEYQKIIAYSRNTNIYLEVYNDEDDFISESKDTDFSVVFAGVEQMNKIRKLLTGEMLFNAFPYDSYEFKVKH